MADFELTLGMLETGEYGNRFNGQTDVDGLIEATFLGSSEALTFSFYGYDFDGNEIELLVNGTSLGLLPRGANKGLTQYVVEIPAALQVDGAENTISFVQRANLSEIWGVTDLLLEEAAAAPPLAAGDAASPTRIRL